MKKIVILLSLFCIISCSDGIGGSSFKDIAEKEMAACIDRRLPHDPNDKPIISNKKEIINTDSAYACVFEMQFKNSFNGWSRSGFTFVCVQVPSVKKVCLYDRIDESLHWAEIQGKYKNDYEKALNYCNFALMKDYVENIP